jgi:hypothetical protein
VTIRVNTTALPSTTAVSPSEPKPVPVGRFDAGLYIAKGFDPELTFEVPAGTFANSEPVMKDSFFVASVDPLQEAALGIVRVEEVFTDFLVADPIQLNHVGKVAPPPADLVAWFRRNPYLTVGPEQTLTVGGKPARRILVTAKTLPAGQGGCRVLPKRCVTLFHSKLVPAAYLGIMEGETEEVTVVDMPSGGPLMFSLGPNPDSPDVQKFAEAARDLIATVKLP